MQALVQLVVETCVSCGSAFAMESSFQRERRKRHDSFYCPAGHAMHYTGKTDAEKLREELARARVLQTHLEDQRDAAQRSATATRGAMTRLKNRVKSGVCPF